MADDRQGLQLTRNLGDAFAEALRSAFGTAPKTVAREIDQDPRAARNALEGKAGVPVITRSLQARQRAADDHYELWLALGQMIFGETLDQYEERKLRTLIESTHNARTLVDARRQRRDELARRAATHARDLDRRSA